MNMTYSRIRLIALLLLRVAIGWHFLYEGAAKLLNPAWSSKTYLMDSQGFLAGFFNWLAANETRLTTVDLLNEWGLTLIGLGLILGLFTRVSSISGIILLLFYYLSHPAWPGLEYMFPTGGNYFIIDKNIVEIFALLVVLYFPTGHIIGIDRFFRKSTNND